MNFKYGKKEMEYLKSRDRRLGEVIDQIGRIRWTVEPDLFSAIVQNIVSQQISGKAAEERYIPVRDKTHRAIIFVSGQVCA